MVRKFTFDKTYEEIEVNDKIFKLPMDDESIIGHREEFEKFHKEARELEVQKTDDMSVDEQRKFHEQTKDMLRRVTNQLLEDEPFEDIYRMSGKSLFNMIDFIYSLSEVVEQYADKNFKKKKEKYTQAKARKIAKSKNKSGK